MDSVNPGQLRQLACAPVSRPPFMATGLSIALVAALIAAEPAYASCASGTINTQVAEPCVLGRNKNLMVTEQGSIIVGSGAAVTLEHATAGGNSLYNSGILSGDQALVLNGTTATGTLQNTATGVMESLTGSAVRISGSTFTGNFANAGQISAPQNGYGVEVLQSTLKGSLSNSGTVQGGIGVFESRVTGDISNTKAGTMELYLNGTTLDGSIRNAGNMAAGNTGLALANALIKKDVLNSGVMGGLEGVSILSTTVQGRVSNTGEINGTTQGLFINGSTLRGGLSNAGEIIGYSQNTIRYSTLGGLENSGTIRSYITALLLDNTFIRGNLSNSGSFLTSNTGHAGLEMIAGTVTGNLVNAGTLNGGPRGYGLITSLGTEIDGDVLNSGYAIGYQGMRLNDTEIGGSFTNTGRLLGGLTTGQTVGDGLMMVNGRIGGNLSNRGAVQGRDDAIVLVGAHIEGQVVNTGFLAAGRNALRLLNTQVDGGLVNSGSIAAREGGYSLYVDSDSRLDALYIADDHARFEGEVYAPATTATVYSTARYILEAVDRWTVGSLVNRGTLVLQAPASRAATPATITGDYTQRSSGVLRTEVNDATHYGKLVVTGTATLPSAARIDVDVASASQPFRVAQLQNVLSAGTLKSDGTYAVTGNSALFDFGAVKDGNTVDLTLAPRADNGVRAAVAAAGRSELASVAAVVDAQISQVSASALTPYFVSAGSTAEVAGSLGQTVPLGSAGLRASQAALMEMSDALQTRLLPTSTGAGFNPGQPAQFWSRSFNTLAGQGRDARSGNTGTVIGIDTRVSPSQRVGLAFAYAKGDAVGGGLDSPQSSRLDLWQFSGYNAYTLAPDTELMLYAGAGRNTINGQRNLDIAGLNGDAKAQYTSLIATVGSSLGHAYQLSEATRLVPALRLDYSHIRDDSYQERGVSALAPLLLKVDARQTDQLIAGLDSRLEHAFSPNGARLSLNVGVGYDLINADNSATASFAGAPGQRFTTAGSEASPWLMRGGLSFATPLPRGAELSLSYDVQTRSDYSAQAATLRVSLPF